jgi:hypothetical protein
MKVNDYDAVAATCNTKGNPLQRLPGIRSGDARETLTSVHGIGGAHNLAQQHDMTLGEPSDIGEEAHIPPLDASPASTRHAEHSSRAEQLAKLYNEL